MKKAMLCSIGSRGDIEPFLALAENLSAHGWEVVCVFPEQFRETVEKIGYRFHGLDRRFLEMLESTEGKALMGGQGNAWTRFQAVLSMVGNSMAIQRQLAEQQEYALESERPDRVFYHPKCLTATVWSMANPKKGAMVSPIPCVTHTVDRYSVIGIRGNGNYGRFFNHLSYWLVNSIRAMATRSYSRSYRQKLGLRVSSADLRRHMVESEQTFYAISPTLFPRPSEWPEVAQVIGYHERDKALGWAPSPELKAFLARHEAEKVVCITFGSMNNEDPEGKTRAILSAIERLSVPAIINASWGGLQHLEGAPEHVHFVDSVPYDWLFPKIYAVVHHGGAGTTHMAAKYGCANMVIPHIVDQFFWNKIVAEKRLGPLGMPIKRLNADSFCKKLGELLNEPNYKRNAEVVKRQMGSESEPEELYRTLTDEKN